MSEHSNTRYWTYLSGIFVICLSCIIIYSNTLNAPFVFDDTINIRDNPHIRITHLNLRKLYDAAFKGPSKYRPVPMISFAINYYFGRYEVGGFHIVNMIIHMINGTLVYFLALIMFKQINETPGQVKTKFHRSSILLMPFFTALVFVTHPIQTQSVTYIVQRMNSMTVMFYLLSLLLYIYGRLSNEKWRRWTLISLSCISWMMAIGSKEIAATLPFVILLYEWYFFQDLQVDWLKRNWKYFIGPFVILVFLVFLYLGGSPLQKILATYEHRDFTLSERVLTQFQVIIFYISLLLFPHPSRLNLLHHIQPTYSLTGIITTLSSLFTIVSLIGIAIYLAKKERLVSFCILWFFVNLAIESSIIGLELVFEHRLYLPMFGFALLLSYLLFYFVSSRRLCAAVTSVFIILSLGTATYLRNMIWKDRITFWTDVVSKSPESYRAHNTLGNALLEKARIEEAIEHYYQALRLGPDDYMLAHNNLGNALKGLGKLNEAINHYAKALRIKPDKALVHFNLAGAMADRGNIDDAIIHYSEALRIKPDFPQAQKLLNIALEKQRDVSETPISSGEAPRVKPAYDAETHTNLGFALGVRGRYDKAIIHFREALQLKPDLAEADNYLGVALTR